METNRPVSYTSGPAQREICTVLSGRIYVTPDGCLYLKPLGVLDSHTYGFCDLPNTLRVHGYYEEELIVMVPMLLLWRKKQRKKLTWTVTRACKSKINHIPGVVSSQGTFLSCFYCFSGTPRRGDKDLRHADRKTDVRTDVLLLACVRFKQIRHIAIFPGKSLKSLCSF
jgi:hypothetical protein